MVGDAGLVDALVVVALADEVDERLRDEREHDDAGERGEREEAEDEPGWRGGSSLDDPGAEGELDDREDDVESEEDGRGGGELAADEVLALAHGGEALVVLEHGDDAGEVPDDAEVDEAGEVGEEDEEGEEAREARAVVGGDEEADEDGSGIVGEEEREGASRRGARPRASAGR